MSEERKVLSAKVETFYNGEFIKVTDLCRAFQDHTGCTEKVTLESFSTVIDEADCIYLEILYSAPLNNKEGQS